MTTDPWQSLAHGTHSAYGSCFSDVLFLTQKKGKERRQKEMRGHGKDGRLREGWGSEEKTGGVATGRGHFHHFPASIEACLLKHFVRSLFEVMFAPSESGGSAPGTIINANCLSALWVYSLSWDPDALSCRHWRPGLTWTTGRSSSCFFYF